MSTKSLPVRLDADLYDRLKELAEIEDSTMVDLVRRALRAFLPQLAAEHATQMEARLERLRTFMRQHPDAVEQSLDEAARAESEGPDPLEEDLVIEVDGERSGDLTRRMREAIGLG